jgi:hypothetical protein
VGNLVSLCFSNFSTHSNFDQKIRPDIRYPASPNVRSDIRNPAFGLAGYPTKSVSGASLNRKLFALVGTTQDEESSFHEKKRCNFCTQKNSFKPHTRSLFKTNPLTLPHHLLPNLIALQAPAKHGQLQSRLMK